MGDSVGWTMAGRNHNAGVLHRLSCSGACPGCVLGVTGLNIWAPRGPQAGKGGADLDKHVSHIWALRQALA